ncbi:MAG: hypothetical protein IJO14_02745 [Clostridia bacterium]|nr:hypothetical protein [Clostridia bacterium]
MKKLIAVLLSVVLAFSAVVGVSAVTVKDNQGNSLVGADALFADFDPTTLTDLFADFDMTVLFAGFDLGKLLATFDLASFLQGLNISSALDNLFSGSTMVSSNRVGVSSLGEFDLSEKLADTDLSALSLPTFDLETPDIVSVADFDLGGITEMLGSFDLGGITDMVGGLFGGGKGEEATPVAADADSSETQAPAEETTAPAETEEKIENVATGGY